MSLTRKVLGLVAALALFSALVPAFASAQIVPNYNYNSNCASPYSNTYPYGNNYSYNYPNNYSNSYPCQQGNLFIYVQVNAPANSIWSIPANNFSVSVSGSAYPATVQGAQNGQNVWVSGAYTATAAPYAGFTPTYSSGCSGTATVGQQISCVVTETPVNQTYYNQYPYNQYPNQYPGYTYPNYNNSQPTVYVTPTYVPRLPNTGIEPQDGAALAFALVALIAAAFFALPYVRKALAIVVG